MHRYEHVQVVHKANKITSLKKELSYCDTYLSLAQNKDVFDSNTCRQSFYWDQTNRTPRIYWISRLNLLFSGAVRKTERCYDRTLLTCSGVFCCGRDTVTVWQASCCGWRWNAYEWVLLVRSTWLYILCWIFARCWLHNSRGYALLLRDVLHSCHGWLTS